MNCEVCGVGVRKRQRVREVFFVNGQWIAVENIPADVCPHCGEVTFDADTAEHVRSLVRTQQRPSTTVEMGVYDFA